MSKHWNPGKATVQLDAGARPSRIRRAPVAINANIPARPQRPANIRERELFFGIIGIVTFGVVIAATLIGFSVFTTFRDDPAADAAIAQFSQCYNAQGPNCVLDGDTIFVDGQRVEIGGMLVPKIADARCDQEHDRGVQAAVGLAELLNSGEVTIGGTVRDIAGRVGRRVEVRDRDVALTMIGQGLARDPAGSSDWCR